MNTKTHRIIIQTGNGMIHGKYCRNEDPSAPVALVLPSHPSTGMTMDNVVVYNLFHLFKEAGMSVLRIDYQEDQKIDPKNPYSIDDIMVDAYDAMQWLYDTHQDASHFCVASLSVGANLVFNLISRRPEIENFIVVSPCASLFNLTELKQKKTKSAIKTNAIKIDDFSSSTMPVGIYVYGDNDEFLNTDEHEKTSNDLIARNSQINTKVISGANHFFSDAKSIEELISTVREYIDISLATRILIPTRKKRRKRKKRDDVIF